MRKTIATAGLIGLVGVLVGFAPRAHADADCRPYAIVIDGQGSRYSAQAGLPRVLDSHAAEYAAMGYRVERLDYMSTVWPIGQYSKDESVADGTLKVVDKVARYRAECASGRVTLIGHSMGAEIAGDLQYLADETRLYGDPRRPGGGVETVLPDVVPGISARGPRELGPNTTETCNQFDVICDASGDPLHLVQGVIGYLTGRHAYAPNDLPPGDHFEPGLPPIPFLPGQLPR